MDYVWIPKPKELFFCLNDYGWVINVNNFCYNESERQELIKNGNYYRTPELAKEANKAEIEFRKTLKHY